MISHAHHKPSHSYSSLVHSIIFTQNKCGIKTFELKNDLKIIIVSLVRAGKIQKLTCSNNTLTLHKYNR